MYNGPTIQYKGYYGSVNYDAEEDVYFGEVINITESIAYEGVDVLALEEIFAAEIEEYFRFCRENGKTPCPPLPFEKR